MTAIVVHATRPELVPQARELAAHLGLSLVEALPEEGTALVVTEERLELRPLGRGAPGPVFVDFVGGKAGHRRRFGGGRNQPLARAAGLKRGASPRVVDATAGLGGDAFVLATLGCEVLLVERSPVVAALLRDGLARAARETETAPIVARMTLMEGDAVTVIDGLPREAAEVIHLDPMYPHREKSALVKKEMRLFRTLVGEDLDAPRLLAAALGHAGRRVVVKRPRLAPPVEGPAPDFVIESKTTRYDIYQPRTLPVAEPPPAAEPATPKWRGMKRH